MNAANGEGEAQQCMSDCEILENLQSQYNLTPHEMGGGGNCLFLSMAEQVSSVDVARALAQLQDPTLDQAVAQLPTAWEETARPTRGKILRQIAVLTERQMLAGDPEEAFLEELFLDVRCLLAFVRVVIVLLADGARIAGLALAPSAAAAGALEARSTQRVR